VYAPGPPIIPEKGEALEAYYKEMYGTTPVNVVHIDKFKYASRILAVGGDLLQPDPYYVQQFSLNELLIRMGGKQVGEVTLMDHFKNFFGWGSSEDAEDAESAVGNHPGQCNDAEVANGCRTGILGIHGWCICGQSGSEDAEDAESAVGSHTGQCNDADIANGCVTVAYRAGFSGWCICGQSGVFYTQQASSGESFIVYGFAAVGLVALVGGAWKTFQNRKLSEHAPLQTNEPEL